MLLGFAEMEAVGAGGGGGGATGGAGAGFLHPAIAITNAKNRVVRTENFRKLTFTFILQM
jgi:hypothetical protein